MTILDIQPILEGKIAYVKSVIVFYKPLQGCGVLDHDRETKITEISFYGREANSNTRIAICTIQLKDYAKTGYYSAGVDYRETTLPVSSDSGNETMSIGDNITTKKFELIYYTIKSTEYLSKLINVQLVLSSIHPLRQGLETT